MRVLQHFVRCGSGLLMYMIDDRRRCSPVPNLGWLRVKEVYAFLAVVPQDNRVSLQPSGWYDIVRGLRTL